MNPRVRAFRQAASQACARGHYPSYTDLIGILNGGGQIETIRRWFQTHYPTP
jgi:hypothetical protein